jgi:hypothetical protein
LWVAYCSLNRVSGVGKDKNALETWLADNERRRRGKPRL